MGSRLRQLAVVALGAALLWAGQIGQAGSADADATDLFISEYVEGSGFNKAVEIYNGTSAPVDLSAYTLELYTNGSASVSQSVTLSGTLAVGDVLVVSRADADPTLVAQADILAPAVINFNGDDAVVLRKAGAVIDAIGQAGTDPGTEWGTGMASTADNTIRRKATVCAGDANPSDAYDPATAWDGFAINTLDGFGAHTASCGDSVDVPPTVSSTTPANNATNVALSADVSVNFSEAVTVTGAWYSISCATSGAHTATVSSGPQSYVLNPDADFADGESCTVTIDGAAVADQDGTPENLAADFVFSFTTLGAAACDTFTPIYDIQGNGASSPLATQVVTTKGTVVADFEGPGPALRGFYIQDVTGDGNVATSDGLFVFNGNNNSVDVGDLVLVTGTVTEFNGLTELSGTVTVTPCGDGETITPLDLTLPVTAISDFEQYEGMLVRLPGAMYIAEYFNYDRFGEVVLSTTRQYQGTHVEEPGVAATAHAATNNLARITLDDNVTSQNPSPIRHPDGSEFTPANSFRGGGTLTDVTGILSFSFDLYRIHPTQGATYSDAGSARPAAPEAVGGSVRVASFNVLNYFTTIDTGAFICGPSGNMECRGADNATELERQRTKILKALTAIDADVFGLIEIQNDAGASAQDLVDGLNAEFGAGTFAKIDTGFIGTDAIKVAFIYNTTTVTPVGDFAILDSSVDPRFIDTLNRPALAQSFEEIATGGVFTAAVNHLKSKGSDCNSAGDPDTGDGSGNCNVTRTNAAEALVDWLDADPTGRGDPDVLLIGDLNSYLKEAPIDALLAGGYTNLVDAFEGPDAYSYVFDGQLGYLDHALANEALTPQVSGVTTWPINADEPDLLDYDTTFNNPIYYATDAYRSSDHDPVIIGLALESVAVDTDGDGIADNADNCDFAVNPGQQDADGDSKGDACDADGLVPAACEGMEVQNIVFGTSGNNTLTGTQYNDLILAGSGNDTVNAGDGNDCIDAGSGNDNVNAGNGSDIVIGGSGNNVIDAGEGDNTVLGGSGKDSVTSGAGNDDVDTGPGNDNIVTGSGVDSISSGSGNDVIDCGADSDSANSGSGNDQNVGTRCESFV